VTHFSIIIHSTVEPATIVARWTIVYVKPSMGSSQKYMIKLYAIYHLLKRIGKCKHPIINPVNMKIKDYHIFGQSYKTLYGICCLSVFTKPIW